MLISNFSCPPPLPLSTARSRPRTCFSALTLEFSSMLMVPTPMPRFYSRDDLLLHRGRLCITSRALSTWPPTSKTKTNRARIGLPAISASHTIRYDTTGHSPVHLYLLTCLPVYLLDTPASTAFHRISPSYQSNQTISHNPLTLFSLFRYDR